VYAGGGVGCGFRLWVCGFRLSKKILIISGVGACGLQVSSFFVLLIIIIISKKPCILSGVGS
jgi:hypothetical protein